MTSTDAQRLAWITAHVDYMEHDAGAAAYWPHRLDDSPTVRDDESVGMSLLEYVDLQIAREQRKAA